MMVSWDFMDFYGIDTLWWCQNSYWKWLFRETFPLKLVIFHNFVKLPEGTHIFPERCHLQARFEHHCIFPWYTKKRAPRQPRNGQGGQGCAMEITSKSSRVHRYMSHLGNHGKATGCCVLRWSTACCWESLGPLGLVVCSCELLLDWRLECLRKFD